MIKALKTPAIRTRGVENFMMKTPNSAEQIIPDFTCKELRLSNNVSSASWRWLTRRLVKCLAFFGTLRCPYCWKDPLPLHNIFITRNLFLNNICLCWMAHEKQDGKWKKCGVVILFLREKWHFEAIGTFSTFKQLKPNELNFT